MVRYSADERVGVNAIERIVLTELGWIFREQPIMDMGIDAHIELVEGGNPTGKLVALQIKTGPGNFRETEDAYVYYGSLVHLEYWTGHSLPVILVAHLPMSDETFWVAIDGSTVEKTVKHWKVSIPKKNSFDVNSIETLSTIFAGSVAQQRLRKLSIDEPLMRHIDQGGTVALELEDWINKSLGRTPVKVFILDTEGNELLIQDWFTYYMGYGIKELAEAIFPWAEVGIDVDFYEENYEFEADCDTGVSQAIDGDHGIVQYEPTGDGIYPYAEAGGEIESYRLVLTLNDLGVAFLTVSDHMSA